MSRPVPALLLFIAIGACATVPQETGPDPKLAAATAGLVVGKPKHCIRLDEAVGSEVVRSGIIYRTSRRLTYVNIAPGCGSVRSDDIMINEVHSSELCRGDIVRFADRTSGFTSGSCALGDFVPYRRPQ